MTVFNLETFGLNEIDIALLAMILLFVWFRIDVWLQVKRVERSYR